MLCTSAFNTSNETYQSHTVVMHIRSIQRPATLRARYEQCRINHVADVANATGLTPQGGLRK